MHKAFTGYTHVGGPLSCFAAGPVRALQPMHPRDMMAVRHGTRPICSVWLTWRAVLTAEQRRSQGPVPSARPLGAKMLGSLVRSFSTANK